MSLGTLLLRPQRITAAPTTTDGDLNLVVDLLTRLFRAITQDDELLTIFEEELEPVLTQFRSTHYVAIEAAFDRFLGFGTPVRRAFEDLAADISDADAVEVIETLIEAVCQLLESLSMASIEAVLNELFDILEEELGVVIEDFVAGLIDPTLDGIVIANALHFTQNQAQVVELLRGYLGPAGRMLVVEYHTEHSNFAAPYPRGDG